MSLYLPVINPKKTDKHSKAVREIIRKNKVPFLIHFTRIENLRSILKFGLLPSSILKGNSAFRSAFFPKYPLPTKWNSFVSMNISFPDYKLFMDLQEHQPSEWVILLIDPKVIIDFPCYFLPDRALNIINTASNPGELLDDYMSAKNLKALFSDQPEIKRRNLDIPLFYTTNPCAEVLSFFPIAPSNIMQIYFASEYKFNQWVLTNTEFALSQDKNRWACGLQFFSPRSDYTYWKTNRSYQNTGS